jgi:hypothetical protein
MPTTRRRRPWPPRPSHVRQACELGLERRYSADHDQRDGAREFAQLRNGARIRPSSSTGEARTISRKTISTSGPAPLKREGEPTELARKEDRVARRDRSHIRPKPGSDRRQDAAGMRTRAAQQASRCRKSSGSPEAQRVSGGTRSGEARAARARRRLPRRLRSAVAHRAQRRPCRP